MDEYLKEWMEKENKRISNVKSCLIIIRPNQKAEVFINFCAIASDGDHFSDTYQLPIRKQDERGTMFGRSFTPGDFHPLSLYPDDGWILIISRWEFKGLYFNFVADHKDQPFNPLIGPLFKEFLDHLQFLGSYHKFPELKLKIYDTGWFPFNKIRGNRFNAISNQIQKGHSIEGLEKSIADSFSHEEIRGIKDSWMKNGVFSSHKSLFDEGIEAYLGGRYISAIHILYPRIEGIMRFLYRGNKKFPTSDDIIKELVNRTKEKNVWLSFQFPDDFRDFIKSSYFKGFDIKENRLNLSRHSLGHGTTSEDEFTRIRAFQAILILDQISWYVYTWIPE